MSEAKNHASPMDTRISALQSETALLNGALSPSGDGPAPSLANKNSKKKKRKSSVRFAESQNKTYSKMELDRKAQRRSMKLNLVDFSDDDTDDSGETASNGLPPVRSPPRSPMPRDAQADSATYTSHSEDEEEDQQSVFDFGMRDEKKKRRVRSSLALGDVTEFEDAPRMLLNAPPPRNSMHRKSVAAAQRLSAYQLDKVLSSASEVLHQIRVGQNRAFALEKDHVAHRKSSGSDSQRASVVSGAIAVHPDHITPEQLTSTDEADGAGGSNATTGVYLPHVKDGGPDRDFLLEPELLEMEKFTLKFKHKRFENWYAFHFAFTHLRKATRYSVISAVFTALLLIVELGTDMMQGNLVAILAGVALRVVSIGVCLLFSLFSGKLTAHMIAHFQKWLIFSFCIRGVLELAYLHVVYMFNEDRLDFRYDEIKGITHYGSITSETMLPYLLGQGVIAKAYMMLFVSWVFNFSGMVSFNALVLSVVFVFLSIVVGMIAGASGPVVLVYILVFVVAITTFFASARATEREERLQFYFRWKILQTQGQHTRIINSMLPQRIQHRLKLLANAQNLAKAQRDGIAREAGGPKLPTLTDDLDLMQQWSALTPKGPRSNSRGTKRTRTGLRKRKKKEKEKSKDTMKDMRASVRRSWAFRLVRNTTLSDTDTAFATKLMRTNTVERVGALGRDRRNFRAPDRVATELPADITGGLLHGGVDGENEQPVIMDYYPEVTILFAYICEFSTYVSEMEPINLIRLLNRVFGDLDDIAAECGVYKIEAIAQSYLLCSGCPVDDPRHCEHVCVAALRIRDRISHNDVQDLARIGTVARLPKLRLKMGINSGSVVAGVIGAQSIKFQLFGDTVNVSSRMASTSEPGKIGMSPHAVRALRKPQDGMRGSDQHFDVTSRGIKQVKGKGEMELFFLNGFRGRYTRSKSTAYQDEQNARKMEERQGIGQALNVAELWNETTLVFAEKEQEESYWDTIAPGILVLWTNFTRVGAVASVVFLGFLFLIFYNAQSYSTDRKAFTEEERDEVPGEFELTRVPRNVYIGWLSIQMLFTLVITVSACYSQHLRKSVKEWPAFQRAKIYKRMRGTTIVALLSTMVGVLILPVAIGTRTTYIQLVLAVMFCVSLGLRLPAFDSSRANFITIFVYTVFLFYDNAGRDFVFMMVAILFVAVVTTRVRTRQMERSSRKRYMLDAICSSELMNTRAMLERTVPFSAFVPLLMTREPVVMGLERITYLYSDIKGFTQLSSTISPQVLCVVMNTLYSAFESHLSEHRVYKIDTIGDAFLVVGGLFGDESDRVVEEKNGVFKLYSQSSMSRTNTTTTSEDGDLPTGVLTRTLETDHADNCVNFGFDMLEEICDIHYDNRFSGFLQKKKTVVQNGRNLELIQMSLQMRIGIHTGKGIGGVLGKDRPRFLIWGRDSVIANKLEEFGTAGYLNISRETHNCLHSDLLEDIEDGLVRVTAVTESKLKISDNDTIVIETMLLYRDSVTQGIDESTDLGRASADSHGEVILDPRLINNQVASRLATHAE